MTNETITVNVIEIKRLDSSMNGNPRYALNTNEGKSYRTKADAGCAYVVSPQPRVEGFEKRYTLTLDGRGSVVGIEEA